MVVIPIVQPEERLARSAEVLTTLLSNVKRNHRNLSSRDLVGSLKIQRRKSDTCKM